MTLKLTFRMSSCCFQIIVNSEPPRCFSKSFFPISLRLTNTQGCAGTIWQADELQFVFLPVTDFSRSKFRVLATKSINFCERKSSNYVQVNFESDWSQTAYLVDSTFESSASCASCLAWRNWWLLHCRLSLWCRSLNSAILIICFFPWPNTRTSESDHWMSLTSSNNTWIHFTTWQSWQMPVGSC